VYIIDTEVLQMSQESKLHVVMHYENETGWYVVTCPMMPGCVSQGKTEQEALANIKEAILGWLEVEDAKAMSKAGASTVEVKELAVAI